MERAAADAVIKATKTEKTRTVRILAPLARDLLAWREACGWPSDDALVFPTARGGLWKNSEGLVWHTNQTQKLIF